jgi:hypothetical protein
MKSSTATKTAEAQPAKTQQAEDAEALRRRRAQIAAYI